MPRTLSRSNRSRARRLSPVELAIGFALVGSLLAIVVPTFAREIHASRSVEPVDGLHHIGAAALAYATDRPAAEAFPPSVGLTPPVVPRGHCEADLPLLWQQPTWVALAFAPASEGSPHCFAFQFDSALSPARSTFRAQAHGDLDGDGISSTFEITGHDVAGDPAGATLDPGMYIDSEVE
jgi:type IV pilus assembly protein PilA